MIDIPELNWRSLNKQTNKQMSFPNLPNKQMNEQTPTKPPPFPSPSPPPKEKNNNKTTTQQKKKTVNLFEQFLFQLQYFVSTVNWQLKVN